MRMCSGQFQNRSQLRSNVLRRPSLNRGRGYELIDLSTLSMGHCLLVNGVRSYSGLHRVNASNCSIEFRPRNQSPRRPLTCHANIIKFTEYCVVNDTSGRIIPLTHFICVSYETYKSDGTIKMMTL